MGKRANGEGTIYKTIKKTKRPKFLAVECAMCKKCTDRTTCNNRVGYDKCDKCKDCKTECLKYCDRFYCQEVWIGQTTVNGKRKTVSTGTKQKEVKENKEEQENKLKNGISIDKSSVTLVDLCREDINVRHDKGKTRDTSHKRLLETLKTIEETEFNNYSLQQLEMNDLITIYLKEFFKEIKKEYSKSVISKIYQLLNSGMKRAIKYKIITSNPLLYDDDLEKPKSDKKTKKIRAFTIEEHKKFVEVLSNKDGIIYDLQYLLELNTGMRMGEINALDKDRDIDFKNKLIIIRRSVTRDKKDKVLLGIECKTDEGERTLIMTDIAEKIFKIALKRWKPNKDNLLFYNYKKDRCISTNAVNSAFKRLCRKYNVAKGDVNQHMLRHTYATRVIEAGVDVDVLAKLLGHTDIKITLNTYCDVLAQRETKQLDLMQDFLEKENLTPQILNAI